MNDMMRRIFSSALILVFLSSLLLNVGFCQQKSSAIPEMKIPVYEKVKDLKLDIPFVLNQKAACAIATPSVYRADAELIQAVILKKTGVLIPIISDADSKAATLLTQNLIILGNRSTSKVSGELYDRYYSLMDLKYPGKEGYSVRSLHDPYGNGHSAVLVGGSDNSGVSKGATAFASYLAASSTSTGNLSVGWTMLTRLGEGVKVPSDLKEFETWEASKGYGSIGYFGWNSISKRMAMYYMTGDPFHAREAIRLSFPDAQALKEIDEIDGERIENKKDPLAGPYHYNAMMTILFWDMIEESPVFNDSERLKVTNAFARRLDHEGTTPFDKTTWQLDAVPQNVGTRHGQWSGMSLYALGRYFNKYYPGPVWAQSERAGKLAFASLHSHAWVRGEFDNLGWYNSAIAPVLTYMIMTGDKVPLQNGVLKKLLDGMEVLISGLKPDWALKSAALDFLNKAAYLTGDGRWITYCQRTELDTDVFRLGQSFWPGEDIIPGLPHNLEGKWLISPMSKEMWQDRNSKIKFEQSFQNMSFRSAADSTGDFVLVKGYNGAYRNPYHTYDIIELRLNGVTILKGFNNQLLSGADGMVEPKVAMDGALLHHEVVGDVAAVVGEVPDLPFANWRRSLALRTGKYALIADDVTFRNDNPGKDMTVRLETSWEIPGGVWMPDKHFIKINQKSINSTTSFELHSSEIVKVTSDNFISMIWQKPAANGQKNTFFHLIGQTNSNGPALSNVKLEDNVAALALPEAALAVSGNYMGIRAELMLLSENTLYGHALLSANPGQPLLSSDFPVEVDWEFESGRLSLVNSNPVRLSLALSSAEIVLDGKVIKGKKAKELYIFDLAAGRHEINNAKPSPLIIRSLSVVLPEFLRLAQQRRTEQLKQDASVIKKQIPALTPVMKANIGINPVESVIISSPQGEFLCTASGNTVYVIDSKGKEIRKMITPGEVKVLHWWAEPKLLLAGCLDEKVIAFDEQGQKKWEFTSVMDPAVYEAGKPYWFKSAYPGISGINSGSFDDDKNRAFIGSSCTLEILDETGQLVKRLPVFWGPGRQFLLVNAADGSKNLLIGRWHNDFEAMAIINSKKMAEVGRGYSGVPAGHTYVGGWDAINRYDNVLIDLDGDGNREVVSAINGIWNRISIYTEEGKSLYNAQIGPGIKGARTNIRAMDTGDLYGDGKQKIITGLSTGFVTVFDEKAGKVWAKAFSSPPVVVKMVRGSGQNWICVGCEDGTVVAMDKIGNITRESNVTGKPSNLCIMNTPEGKIAVFTTESGEVAGFNNDN